jgi:hypothetical protein
MRTNFLADVARNVMEWVMIDNEALFTHESISNLVCCRGTPDLLDSVFEARRPISLRGADSVNRYAKTEVSLAGRR